MSSRVTQRRNHLAGSRQSSSSHHNRRARHNNNNSHYSNYNDQQSTSTSRTEPTIPGAFFLGNIDKQLTREEVYEFIRENTRCYIKKFDMPNVIGGEQDPSGRPIRCAGFAFVHVKHQWMADEMLKRGKIRIGNLDSEIKPYDQMKREMSERRHRANTARSEASSVQHQDSQSNVATTQSNGTTTDTKYTGTENWAIEEHEADNYNPNGLDWSMKISSYGDKCLEDDSQYQTEDDSVSVISRSASQVNVIEASSMYSSRAPTPSQRRNRQGENSNNNNRMNPGKLNVPENTIIVGEVTQQLIEDGITPTAEKINALASERYNVEAICETKQPSFSKQLSVRSQIQQAKVQVEEQVAATTTVLPILPPLSHAPASIIANTTTPPTVALPTSMVIPYFQSPTYHAVQAVASQVVQTDPCAPMVYNELVNQWLTYYAQNPAQAFQDVQRTEFDQITAMQNSISARTAQQQMLNF
jgi:hypothetical protein